jgi:hypothetical protein
MLLVMLFFFSKFAFLMHWIHRRVPAFRECTMTNDETPTGVIQRPLYGLIVHLKRGWPSVAPAIRCQWSKLDLLILDTILS